MFSSLIAKLTDTQKFPENILLNFFNVIFQGYHQVTFVTLL
jgi:hypothetical protein